MLTPIVANYPGGLSAWNDVARLCRRICLLEERGRADEAAHLRDTDLPGLIAPLRASADADEITARVEALFLAERERVANAAALAEVLAPLLHAASTDSAPPAPTASRISPDAARTQSAGPSRAPQHPRRTPGDIADFIDEMIAQDAVAHHADRSARRAS